jgi:glutamine phosphoribosylpyrophosphate amidotransferase
VIIQKLKDLGAKSVDWVSGLPMVTNICYLGISIRTQEELVAFLNNCDSKEIARAIGARSVTFINSENIIRAANNGKFIKPKIEQEVFKCNGFCGGCLNYTEGNVYPVSKDGVPYKGKI